MGKFRKLLDNIELFQTYSLLSVVDAEKQKKKVLGQIGGSFEGYTILYGISLKVK